MHMHWVVEEESELIVARYGVRNECTEKYIQYVRI
jgi:hypothetical protein